MSTAAEIESAIERLPAGEIARLRDWLLERAPVRPKTGAELAALWPSRFHLSPIEADELARDMESRPQSAPQAPAWE